ncbi:MAG: hypothetical protein V5A77_00735 [Candidatus Bipolaricaulota bacterium]
MSTRVGNFSAREARRSLDLPAGHGDPACFLARTDERVEPCPFGLDVQL